MSNSKMIKSILLVNWLLFFQAIVLVRGQLPQNNMYLNNEIKIERIGMEQGLYNKILHLLQDRKGFMWFATLDGLYKYDGYALTEYQNNLRDTNSLADHNVSSLYEDHSGLLWTGLGGGGGVNSFNPQTSKWKRFPHNPDNYNSIAKGPIHSIAEDQFGMLWFGSLTGGLTKYNPKTDQFTRYEHSQKNIYSLGNDSVYSVLADRVGRLWVGTSIGVDLFDTKTNRFYHIAGNIQDGIVLKNGAVHHIYEDNNGLLWLSTLHDGLYVLNPATKKFQAHYTHDPKQSNSLSDNYTSAVTQDKNGDYWITTLHDLNRLDLRTGRFTLYKNKDYLPENENKTNVHTIITDQSGLIWVGIITKGVIYFSPNPRNFRSYLNNENASITTGSTNAHSIFRAGNCHLYVATDYSLFRFDSAKDDLTLEYQSKTRKDIKEAPVITAACEEKPGVFWLGTDSNGIIRFNSHSGKETFFQYNSIDQGSLASNSVNVLLRDRSGTIWIGLGNGHLQWFDPAKKKFVNYAYRTNKPDYRYETESIQLIYEDRQGNLWIAIKAEFLGTGGRGIYKINRKTGEVFHYKYSPDQHNSLSSDAVTCIYEDENSIIWIGTYGGGLNKLDVRSGKITFYTKEDGLQSNKIDGLAGDKAGNLWITTRAGITLFNPGTLQLNWFDLTDGLAGPPEENATFQDADGTIYFGSINGLMVFNPERIYLNTSKPPVAITHFKVFENIIQYKGQALTLSYDQNFFDIEFSALSFLSSGKNRYAYMLEGLDKDWIYSGTRRVARYTNVSPGKYIFRVKAANNDGIWNEEGAAITITINPPWWKTWWFRIIAVCCVIALFYSLVRWRIHQKFRMQLAHSEKEKQLAELQHQKGELEMQSLRAQMNPHFIFNCLSSINKFILKNESQPASDYLTKFSRLIRMVLANSKKSFITLEDELEMLRLYLEMERLRFRHSFNYNISFKNEIDPENIFIPPLLLQPFAENAIWHGLMHKQGEGHLEVELSIEKKILTCTITDNGIGRHKAAMIKSKSAEKEKSMGLKITTERLALLNQDMDVQTFFEIEDMTDDQGNALGTKVSVKMYYRDLEEAFA